MNKFLAFILFLVIGLGSVYSADNAGSLNYHSDVSQAYAIADASDGDCAEVDSDGSLQVIQHKNSIATVMSDDAYAVSTACTLYGLIVSGTDAGDYALIYDGNSTTGTLILDICVGTALDTKTIILPSGITITYDIYVDVKDDDVEVSVIYDS